MPGIADVDLLERMVSAVEKVRERLLRAAGALDRAGISYAVVGGNAVAFWVASVDEAAVRNTANVDILLRRSDLAAATAALQAADFVYRHVGGMDVFLDGPEGKVRSAIHVIFAGEKVRPHEALPNPEVREAEADSPFRVLALEALVQIKLTAFRRKDQVHLLDMLEVGLIDETWKDRYPPELATRLQLLIDTPEG